MYSQTIAQQPPPPPNRVKTSRKFDINTVGDNQYYLSICLFILVCVLCNPIALLCAIPGFLAAQTISSSCVILFYALGPMKCVLITEVSSFQGAFNEVGTWSSVLIREVSFKRGSTVVP